MPATSRRRKAWLRYGGLATLESFAIEPPLPHEDGPAFAQRLAEGLTPEVVEWLKALPLSITCGDYFFCHAGVRPGAALARQRREDLLWIRQPFLYDHRNFGAVVVHGHTIVDDVLIESNRIAVDTGAYATGVLSAVCLDGTYIDMFATAGASARLVAPRRHRSADGPLIRASTGLATARDSRSRP